MPYHFRFYKDFQPHKWRALRQVLEFAPKVDIGRQELRTDAPESRLTGARVRYAQVFLAEERRWVDLHAEAIYVAPERNVGLEPYQRVTHVLTQLLGSTIGKGNIGSNSGKKHKINGFRIFK